MTLFGDPRAPRRNLWGGLTVTAIGALLVGLAVAQVAAAEPWPGAQRFAWLQVVLGAAMAFGGVMQFRLGLGAASFPDVRDGSEGTDAPRPWTAESRAPAP